MINHIRCVYCIPPSQARTNEGESLLSRLFPGGKGPFGSYVNLTPTM